MTLTTWTREGWCSRTARARQLTLSCEFPVLLPAALACLPRIDARDSADMPLRDMMAPWRGWRCVVCYVCSYATGYHIRFPFLHDSCGVNVSDDNQIALYKYMFPLDTPRHAPLGARGAA